MKTDLDFPGLAAARRAHSLSGLWRRQSLARRAAAAAGALAAALVAMALLLQPRLDAAAGSVEAAPPPAIETVLLISAAAAIGAASLTHAAAAKTIGRPLDALRNALENRRPVCGQTAANGAAEIRRLAARCDHAARDLDQAARSLRVAQAELERGRAASSRILANVSHELRTPLNGVLGMAQLLKATPLEDRQRDIADTILASGEALANAVDDLLDASALDAGQMSFAAAPFDPAEVAGRVLGGYGPIAALKGLALDSVVELPPDARFLGDAGRLRQAVGKLACNAVKFTERGSVTLAVLPGERGDGLRFEVRDTGPGVNPALRAAIFEPFRQGDDSDTRRHGGTGLGLSIGKALVERMGGAIGVRDRAGGGAVFWIELPLERLAEAPTEFRAAVELRS